MTSRITQTQAGLGGVSILLLMQAGSLVAAACAPQTGIGAAAFLVVCAVVSIAALCRLVSVERSVDRLEARRAADSAAAAESMREREEFFASATHEVRTPLTSILGYADILLSRSLPDDDRQRHVATIRTAGEHLLSIVNDMLDLAKADAGKMTVESLEVSPLAIADEVIGLLRNQAEARGLSLGLRCDGPLPVCIRSDPVRLRQVLLNLVGNAIRFTERGEVRVHLGMDGSRDVERPSLRFEVRDTGPGLRADQIDRLFRPFAQSDASVARVHGGTGLGLALAGRIAPLLGGSITVSSEPGKGSTFGFSVSTGPLADVPFVEGVAAVLGQARPETGARLTGSVLLAEDSPDSQRLIALHLRTLGLEVVAVEDGRKAVHAALHRPTGFDLILLDDRMPGHDGPRALQELRERGVRCPILALAAPTERASVDRCMAAGFDEVLSKPIDRSSLAAACARWLADRRERRNAA